MKRLLVVAAALVVALVALPPLLAPALGLAPGAPPPPGRELALGPGNAGPVVNVFVAGAGPPVVLVHGLPGSAYDWGTLPDALAARGVRVVVYDRVGYGHSSRRPAGEAATFGANADELLRLLDRLGIARAVLVGWSYGGGVVQVAAQRAPERAAALVLVGSVGPDLPRYDPSLVERVMLEPAVARWGFASGWPARASARLLLHQAFGGADIPPEWIDRSVALLAQEDAWRTWLRENAGLRLDGLHPESLRMPGLVIQGAADALVPLAVAEGLHRRLPGSTLRVVEDGSHMLPVTHTDLLADWIAALAVR